MISLLNKIDEYINNYVGIQGVTTKCNEILRFDYDKQDPASIPYWEIALFLYMTNVSIIVANAVPKLKSSWAYDFFFTLVGGFGGGILNPVLLCMDKHFPFPMGSDIVIPVVFTAWYCIHYVPYYYDLVKVPAINNIVLIGFECVRAFLIQTWALRATSHIKPSYFSFAVFGPLFCGTIAGCGGFFCLLGPEGIMKMVPWPVQSAFLASLFHLILTNGVINGIPKQNHADAHTLILFFLITTRLIPIKTRNFIFNKIFGFISYVTRLSNDIKPSPLKMELHNLNNNGSKKKKKKQ